ncbi:MAG: RHS repeat protein [Zoogloeaceae bacterium]|jgi:uncharacterized protein RhaS with RHS repeats|nr:RHS repeat protein [Zoogloeaceae bacterium]
MMIRLLFLAVVLLIAGAHDALGRVTVMTDPLGHETRREWVVCAS